MVSAPAEPLQVGDVVELARVPTGRTKGLAVGMRGEVVCELGWAVTVEWAGPTPRATLLRPSYLRRVERAAAEATAHG